MADAVRDPHFHKKLLQAANCVTWEKIQATAIPTFDFPPQSITVQAALNLAACLVFTLNAEPSAMAESERLIMRFPAWILLVPPKPLPFQASWQLQVTRLILFFRCHFQELETRAVHTLQGHAVEKKNKSSEETKMIYAVYKHMREGQAGKAYRILASTEPIMDPSSETAMSEYKKLFLKERREISARFRPEMAVIPETHKQAIQEIRNAATTNLLGVLLQSTKPVPHLVCYLTELQECVRCKEFERPSEDFIAEIQAGLVKHLEAPYEHQLAIAGIPESQSNENMRGLQRLMEAVA